MKLIRNKMLSMLALTVTFGALASELEDISLMSTESEFQHTAAADNSLFEFKNKTKQPKRITLLNGNQTFFEAEVAASKGSAEKDHGYVRAKNNEFNNSLPTRILVKNKVGTVESDCMLPADKTLYLTYEKGSLRAQEGKKGKTQSGLSLTNNVSTKEILCIPPVNTQRAQQTGFPARDTKTTNWQIEIKNKTFGSIDLTIYVVDASGQSEQVASDLISTSKGTDEKDHGYIRYAGIDPRSQLMVFINDSRFVIAPNNGRKTVYLTIEHDNDRVTLRPQQGTGVFSKKTQSGLELDQKFNVKIQDISEE